MFVLRIRLLVVVGDVGTGGVVSGVSEGSMGGKDVSVGGESKLMSYEDDRVIGDSVFEDSVFEDSVSVRVHGCFSGVGVGSVDATEVDSSVVGDGSADVMTLVPLIIFEVSVCSVLVTVVVVVDVVVIVMSSSSQTVLAYTTLGSSLAYKLGRFCDRLVSSVFVMIAVLSLGWW
jgi:hypothetical protein